MFSRYKFILAVLFVFGALIIFKLGKTTLRDSSSWNDLAENGIKDSVTIYPDRGMILAADGSILSTSVVVYSPEIDFHAEPFRADTLEKYIDSVTSVVASIDPSRSSEQVKEYILDRLTKYKEVRRFNDSIKNAGDTVTKLKKIGYYRKARLLKDCFRGEIQKLYKCKFFRTTGGKYTLVENAHMLRRRPYGKMASQCIGAVRDTIINGKTVFMGTRGLERALDHYLFGKVGVGSTIQLTSSMPVWEKVKPVNGYDVVTTIDVHIQDMVETELDKVCKETEAEWGTAVIMEVATGEIKAISNLQRDTTKAGEVFYREGMNHAVMGYEPGSVIKPISLMIALEDNVVKPNEYISTGARFAYAGGRPITDSHAYARLTTKEVIAASSNIGMSKIIVDGYADNPARFYKRFADIGMFDSLKLGIYGERLPYIPKLGNKNWDRIDMTRISYGYTSRIPPIYTLAFYNAIANGGKFVRPRIVKELRLDGVTDTVFGISYVRERICREDVAQTLREALRMVVTDNKGTGKALRNNFVEIAGKTGTAYDIVGKNYDHSRKRLAFCGFFPYQNPKYSCIVLMSRAKVGAARSSGKVLLNVALKMYSLGMLGNSSNFRTESDNQGGVPTLLSMDNSEMDAIKTDINAKSVKHFPNKQPKDGVPSVVGMGLRDAVATLEKCGLNVECQGSGYVCSQSLKPGTQFKKGTKIKLTLKV